MAGTDTSTPCEVCGTPAEGVAGGFDGTEWDCPRCGQFKMAGTAGTMLDSFVDLVRLSRLPGWIREQNDAANIPMITSDVLKQVMARPLPGVVERAERMLLEAYKGQGTLGERFNINDPRFLGASYSVHMKEVAFLLKLLKERGMMEGVVMGGGTEILPSGYIHIDELTRKPSTASQGFVAMWFDPEMNKAYSDGFQPGILAAGYNPTRVDQVEHANKIDDEIIAQIKVSRFVVADFTEHRGGVYFEAGFAQGLGLPVIWTCHKDHMDGLHFDIRQFNCIDWETPAELADRLQKRIEAVIGVGPKKVVE